MLVKDLILRLQMMPQDAIVVIQDADTDWLLKLSYVGTDDPETMVVLGADYSDEIGIDKSNW